MCLMCFENVSISVSPSISIPGIKRSCHNNPPASHHSLLKKKVSDYFTSSLPFGRNEVRHLVYHLNCPVKGGTLLLKDNIARLGKNLDTYYTY